MRKDASKQTEEIARPLTDAYTQRGGGSSSDVATQTRESAGPLQMLLPKQWRARNPLQNIQFRHDLLPGGNLVNEIYP